MHWPVEGRWHRQIAGSALSLNVVFEVMLIALTVVKTILFALSVKCFFIQQTCFSPACSIHTV